MGEALAFGSLLKEGYKVRLSGQDVERGTFSQRHSVLFDQETEKRYTPLNHLGGEQASFEVINSMLSEVAVLGFEYGYSLAEAEHADALGGAVRRLRQRRAGRRRPVHLVGRAQVAADVRPRHACCRTATRGRGRSIPRPGWSAILQMCAEDNMQVANCTTPANYFHILRRQMHRNFRKPLILMTPKSLLRHKRAVSRLDELADGSTFHRLLYDDAEMLKGAGDQARAGREDAPRRDLLGQGLFRPLRGAREARRRRHLPPARRAALSVPAEGDVRAARRASRAPRSSGARKSRRTWAPGPSSSRAFRAVLDMVKAGDRPVRYAGPAPRRPRPATGLMSKHLEQREQFLEEALGG